MDASDRKAMTEILAVAALAGAGVILAGAAAGFAWRMFEFAAGI